MWMAYSFSLIIIKAATWDLKQTQVTPGLEHGVAFALSFITYASPNNEWGYSIDSVD